MTKEQANVIQTALWAALVLVQMTVVGALEVRAETVRREVNYEAIEGEADFPEEITVSVLAGNDEELVTCQAVECVEEAVYWQDDFSFPLTFYEYGAEGYQLGERVLKTEELPVLAEVYEEELLRNMGLSMEEYQIRKLEWAGEPYENEDGILCRDAVGYGSRLLRNYRVAYEGDVAPERWKELKRGGQEEVEEEQIPEETWPEETEEAEQKTETAAERVTEIFHEPEQKKTKWQEFLEKVTKILLVAVGLGAMLFFGGLFVLALVWIFRKLREWDRNR